MVVVDNLHGRAFSPSMAGKTFQEMTLDEIFEFEKTHSCNIGHSGVTEEGFKRYLARQAKAKLTLPKSKKRRPAKLVVA